MCLFLFVLSGNSSMTSEQVVCRTTVCAMYDYVYDMQLVLRLEPASNILGSVASAPGSNCCFCKCGISCQTMVLPRIQVILRSPVVLVAGADIKNVAGTHYVFRIHLSHKTSTLQMVYRQLKRFIKHQKRHWTNQEVMIKNILRNSQSSVNK